MYDFEALLGELLSSRPELSRDDLMRRIAEKKETVGAGYLTDQGALFLVAGELGVTLKREASPSEVPLKDMYIGANDVTAVARTLAIYPVSVYKKKDGGEGKYRRMVLFDGGATVKLTIWDEKAEEVGRMGIAVDVPVRVVGGYVKQGLDGKPTLNLGSRGTIEVVPDPALAARLPKLAAVTERLGKVSAEKQYAAVECVVESQPRYSEFVRSDGTPGSLFQFGVTGEGGADRARVVIWSPASRPELKPGQRVVITNLRSRWATGGEYELHGDAGSTVVEGPKKEPALYRVAASSTDHGLTVAVVVDREKRARVLEAGEPLGAPKGAVVRVTPDEEKGGRMICRSPGSLEEAQGDSFPRLAELTTKLKDARDEASTILVEVIALSHATTDEIPLKDGTSARKGEIVVGDDTAEMKVVAWREQSEKLSGIQPGERLRISGVTPKALKMGNWVLQAGSATFVERLRGRD